MVVAWVCGKSCNILTAHLTRAHPLRQVYPIVSYTEKDIARMEAEGLCFPCADDDEADETSSLFAVRAVPAPGQNSDDDSTPREFATGRVSRLPAMQRFDRWLRKKLGLRVPDLGPPEHLDPAVALRLMYQHQDDEKSRCAVIRDMVNSASAAVIVVSMVMLAVLLIVYYFKSELSFSSPFSSSSSHSSSGGRGAGRSSG